MCRNIRTLHNFEPPVTEEEIRAAALQYVRKVSGFARPSQRNAAPFAEAVEEVALATRRLIGRLESGVPARSREGEAVKARERWRQRTERLRSSADRSGS